MDVYDPVGIDELSALDFACATARRTSQAAPSLAIMLQNEWTQQYCHYCCLLGHEEFQRYAGARIKRHQQQSAGNCTRRTPRDCNSGSSRSQGQPVADKEGLTHIVRASQRLGLGASQETL